MENKIILLADDDTDDTELFREALADIDNRIACLCADNGSLLLQQLKELDRQPDLIFLDLNMPVMNGWQCLKLLKEDERYRHIPVIMISTSSHQKEMDMASDLGALCYLVKPNNFDDLVQVLGVIVAHLGPGLRNAVLQLKKNGSKLIFACK